MSVCITEFVRIVNISIVPIPIQSRYSISSHSYWHAIFCIREVFLTDSSPGFHARVPEYHLDFSMLLKLVLELIIIIK